MYYKLIIYLCPYFCFQCISFRKVNLYGGIYIYIYIFIHTYNIYILIHKSFKLWFYTAGFLSNSLSNENMQLNTYHYQDMASNHKYDFINSS